MRLSSGGDRMKLAFIAALAVAGLAAFFAVQNAQVSKVSFLGWYLEAPMVMVLLITFAAGVLTTMLSLLPASLKKSLEIKRLKAQLQSASQAAVKNQPIQPTPQKNEPVL